MVIDDFDSSSDPMVLAVVVMFKFLLLPALFSPSPRLELDLSGSFKAPLFSFSPALGAEKLRSSADCRLTK